MPGLVRQLRKREGELGKALVTGILVTSDYETQHHFITATVIVLSNDKLSYGPVDN